MDRELVLGILVAVMCGGALTAGGWWPIGLPVAASGRGLERRAWRRMWLPFGPAVLLFAALCGWALVEPACAERVPNCLAWAAVPFAVVAIRAAWRAVRSLMRSHQDVAVATVGVWRPWIILSPRVAAALDAQALAAALDHERVHAQHRDPLRLWLAQLGCDLLWPWPMASARFLCWRQALELARDEEARLNGAAGPDLAAAILGALRFSHAGASPSAATLGGDASFVQDRIARLMRPVDAEALPSNRRMLWLCAVAVSVTAAVLLGTEFGERVVRALLALV
ncbi:MAG: M56 family metallopeptidase [Candidatus Binatia bacterium]